MISGASRTYDELKVGTVYRTRFRRTVPRPTHAWSILTINTSPIHFDAAHAPTDAVFGADQASFANPAATRGTDT